MDCSEVRELIPLFMDNELSQSSTLEVASHIDGCISCRQELEYDKSLRMLLQKWNAPKISPDKAKAMKTRLMDKLSSKRQVDQGGPLKR